MKTSRFPATGDEEFTALLSQAIDEQDNFFTFQIGQRVRYSDGALYSEGFLYGNNPEKVKFQIVGRYAGNDGNYYNLRFHENMRNHSVSIHEDQLKRC